MPQLDVEYGGLARHQLGEWGVYDAARMREGLRSVHAVQRGAVLKAATDGGSGGILLLQGFGKPAGRELASALPDDRAPSASLHDLKARSPPTHPGAPPEGLGSWRWPQQPGSGRPKVEEVPLPTTMHQAS